MKNIEVKNINARSLKAIYTQNITSTTTFLRHSEDRITTYSKEQVEIEVFNNGNRIFFGTKEEFFNKLLS